MDCLPQCRAKQCHRETKLATINQFKKQPESEEEGAMHLVRLEMINLGSLNVKSYVDFKQVVFPAEPEVTSRKGIVLHQYETRFHSNMLSQDPREMVRFRWEFLLDPPYTTNLPLSLILILIQLS